MRFIFFNPVARILAAIADLKDTILMNQTELQAALDAVNDQLTKATAEINAEIATLTAEIAAGGVTTPGVDASLARLQGLAQALDDLNPDAPPPAPAPAPAPSEG